MKKILIILLLMSAYSPGAFSQQDAGTDRDTFFLARKKGLIGKLGRSITRNNFPEESAAKVALPYERFKGRIIRTLSVVSLAFNRNVHDTTYFRQNIGIRLANALHKNSRESLIRRNLFFKEGDVFYPLLVSDNERFLRDLSYLQDALIVAYEVEGDPGKVDVIVITKDVFSLGGKATINTATRMRGEISEDNFNGSGSRVALLALYDENRRPGVGYGFEYVKRAIRRRKGLMNWTTGFTTFQPALVNGRREENRIYTTLDKLFITRYTEWLGSLSLSYHMTSNAFETDSVYRTLARYRYLNADAWLGYNIAFGSRKTDSERRLRHFFALRSFYTHFDQVPAKYQTEYNFNYANINGVLAQYNIYRQNFYKTKFIYGFGRNEDVPVGFHAGITSGWTNKQGLRRWYYGLEFEGSHYAKRGFYSLYTARIGGFMPRGSGFEDISMLLAVDHFTKLRWVSKSWLNRNFVNVSYSRQFRQVLNAPFFLQSNEFGLPYVRNLARPSDERTTIKLESVFMHTRKFAGFRIAPFAFADVSFLRPMGESFDKTTGYPAFGGGFRTRNENLVFGTIEVRGFYFPRIEPGFRTWKIDVSTNVRFRYNTNFIRRPDFVNFN